jgi:predicted PurR-regulated permease PerM
LKFQILDGHNSPLTPSKTLARIPSKNSQKELAKITSKLLQNPSLTSSFTSFTSFFSSFTSTSFTSTTFFYLLFFLFFLCSPPRLLFISELPRGSGPRLAG